MFRFFTQISAGLVILLSALLTTAAPSSTLEQLKNRQSCASVVVYFARGTTETGTLGTVVGPPFQSALVSVLGTRSLNFVGINYPATVDGYLAGGDVGGATTMANSVTSTANACPNAKIVISGCRYVWITSCLSHGFGAYHVAISAKEPKLST